VSGCPAEPDFKEGKVFSFFICQFEQLLNEILSKVYCAVVGDLTPAIMAGLTLLVVLTGVGFLMGLVPFTAKELAILGAKFSLVLVFATQAEYMIGIGYNLFVNMAKEGITFVLDFIFVEATKRDFGEFYGITTFSSVSDVYALFDAVLEKMMSMASEGEQENSQCKNAIFTMLVAVAVVVPPVAFMGIYFLFKFLWMILRAIFGYCQGLLGLTFLTVLAPIYISFALFKPTRTLFDKWVKYLISFSFQMVIVFAFLGMVFYIMSQIADDLKSYGDLVQPYKKDVQSGPAILSFADTCGICELESKGPKEAPSCKANGKVLPLEEMQKDEDFLKFAVVKVVAMIVLFYILDIMMGFVPEMARHLAGPKYAGQLGGGAGGNAAMPLPGEQAIGGMLSSAGNAFMKGNTSADGTVSAVRAAVVEGVVGDRGLIAGAIRGAVNPNEPFRNPAEFDKTGAGALFGAAAMLTGGVAVARAFNSGGIGDAIAGGATPTSAPDDGFRGGSPNDTPPTHSAASKVSSTDQAAIAQHLDHKRRAGVDVSVASAISQAVSRLPKGASSNSIQQALANEASFASKADVEGAIAMLSAIIDDPDILEEIRHFAGTRSA
jgi:type IV secretory pathway VirB6-like protein